MSTATHVTVATRIEQLSQQLIAAVRQYWPKRGLTAAQAVALCEKYERLGIGTICEALEFTWREQPENPRVNWRRAEQIAWAMVRKRWAQPVKPKDDGLEDQRIWLRSWKGQVPWAVELLSEDQAGKVMAADLVNWVEQWQPVDRYGFYHLPVIFGSAARPAEYRMVRTRLLLEAHGLVRNLRTFGVETIAYRGSWLERLEADARRGGVTLPTIERPELEDPF